jgi:NAD-dependent dihydropyrimidine dehydrogenase PreA subunit
MTHVVTDACIGVKDQTCTSVCPVDAFDGEHDESQNMVFINPHDCIDCGQCLTACPVEAIFPINELPEASRGAIAKAYRHFGIPLPNS